MTQANALANASTMTLQEVLDWLGSEHSLTPRRHRFVEMGLRVSTVKNADLSVDQRIELLDLLDIEAHKIIDELLSTLIEAVLPVPKERRKLVRAAQDFLEVQAACWVELLAETANDKQRGRLYLCAIDSFSRHLLLSFTSSFPAYLSIWRQLHRLFYNAAELGLDLYRSEAGKPTIRDRYLHIILISCLQPAAFTSAELLFISEYIAQQENLVDLFDAPPENAQSVFWVPVNEDVASHALNRRLPEVSEARYYFACDPIAGKARSHIANIERGVAARSLGVPVFAMTPAGRGVLRRIADMWSKPVRRRFQRRMDSQRVYLRIGLGSLWWSLNYPDRDTRKPSQWMVTNKSAEGYAVMHVSGKTRSLHVGDIVALQEEAAIDHNWHWQLCMVRWALSENPEHLELGLQVISPAAIPAEFIVPRLSTRNPERGKLNVFVLPELPPVRPNRSILGPSGRMVLGDDGFLLFSGERLRVQEIRLTAMNEQTGHVEMYQIASIDSD